MKQWEVVGTRHGRTVTVWVAARDVWDACDIASESLGIDVSYATEVTVAC